jgi:hypothetical protein
MLPEIGTKVKILTDLYDSDDVELLANVDDIAEVKYYFDDHVILEISGVEFVAFSDEYEVLP